MNVPPMDLFEPLAGTKREKTAAEDQFDKLAGKETKRKDFSLAPAAIQKAREEATEMARTGIWDRARGVHLVATYAWLHREVYGVEAVELDGVGHGSAAVKAAQREWAVASVLAQRFCAQNFGGEMAECVEFLRWSWKREQHREKKRRAGEREHDDFRMGWRLQFSARLVTDYRIDRARRHP